MSRAPVHADKRDPPPPPPCEPPAALTGAEHNDWAAAITKRGLLRIHGCMFADTADEWPRSLRPLLNQGRTDLIASLAKGGRRGHIVQRRGRRRGEEWVDRAKGPSLS